jgi:hypothetical protein
MLQEKRDIEIHDESRKREEFLERDDQSCRRRGT